MTAVLTRQTHLAPSRLAQVFQRVYQQLTWRHGLAVLGAAAAMSIADLAYLVEKLHKPGVALIIKFNAGSSLALFSIVLIAWLITVDSASAFHRTSRWKLAAIIVFSAVLTTVVTMPVAHAMGLEEAWLSLMERRPAPPPVWLPYLSSILQFSVFGFLFVAAAETFRRRSATQLAVQSAQREQAAIARGVLESRLAAMQAQVEPQFLFDSLVDIETLYRKDANRAAEDLDRLITYLRVALPRLREPGSTLSAEMELVRAYLGVVTSLHEGRPVLTVTLPQDCRDARFYPMLLLPLLQRAVRHPSGVMPESIKIGISRIADQIVIVLRFALSDYCEEDPELGRVRERLTGLFGASASLVCEQLSDVTQITLRVPAAGAAKK